MPPLPTAAPDGQRWITARQGADMFGVSQDAIHRWAAIGYIPEAAIRWHGRRKMYRLDAVADAELMAREAAQRTSSPKRTVRHFTTAA